MSASTDQLAAPTTIRPMRPEDVPVAEQLSDESFVELDRRVYRRDQPDPTPRGEAHRAGWIARTRHFLDTDPGGCWVADDGAGMLGFATSVRRDGTWILATYAVRPDHQLMQSIWRWIVVDSTTGTGYAYLNEHGPVALLAADNQRTAARLLWTAIAEGPVEQSIAHVTAANAWAVDVGTACRLDLHTSGYLALRGMKPPTPYLHHGAML